MKLPLTALLSVGLLTNPITSQSIDVTVCDETAKQVFSEYEPVVITANPDITVLHYDISHNQSVFEELLVTAGNAYKDGDEISLAKARHQSQSELLRLQQSFDSISEYFRDNDISIGFLETDTSDVYIKLDENTTVTSYMALHSYIQTSPQYTPDDVKKIVAQFPDADFGYGNLYASQVKRIFLIPADYDTHPDIREINMLESILRSQIPKGIIVPIITSNGDIDFKNIVDCINDTGKYSVSLTEYKPSDDYNLLLTLKEK